MGESGEADGSGEGGVVEALEGEGLPLVAGLDVLLGETLGDAWVGGHAAEYVKLVLVDEGCWFRSLDIQIRHFNPPITIHIIALTRPQTPYLSHIPTYSIHSIHILLEHHRMRRSLLLHRLCLSNLKRFQVIAYF